jgi:hypothetical protein
VELLEQFTRGDSEAFETLFRQFQGEVYGWIVRVVRDPGAAEDLTVETFWRIYRHVRDSIRSAVSAPGRGGSRPVAPYAGAARPACDSSALVGLGAGGRHRPASTSRRWWPPSSHLASPWRWLVITW